MTPKQLKEFRKKHGLSQEKLAEIVGRNRENISRYENEEMAIPFFFDAVLEKWERENDPV